MGKGMSEFIEREVITLEDWDLYCHYVAGLVGIGLSNLFAASGLEDESYRHCDKLSNSMGLFLQKTNIIRDYLEDINQDRIFWPRAVWYQWVLPKLLILVCRSRYTNKLENFKKPKHAKEVNSPRWCHSSHSGRVVFESSHHQCSAAHPRLSGVHVPLEE